MISIIIPIYNEIKYLMKCLDSIKNQTFSDYECLCIDDGSTDGCTEIIKEYCKEDSRFKYLSGKHIGFPLSKNLGLDEAKGEYICFVDSDDYIEPKYLETLLNAIIESNADICCCRYTYFKDIINIRPGTNRVQIYTDNKMSILLSPVGSSFMWNKIYKKEIFDDMRFEDVIALSDTMICYKLFHKAKSISTVDSFLINHRVHNENMTYHVRNFEPTYWEHRLNVYIDMCNFIYDNYPQTQFAIKQRFRYEFLSFIKPHLTKEVFELYNNREDLKRLYE